MESRNKVRVAMIGAGRMANQVHYPSLASFDDVEIAGICDLDQERLRTTADRYEVERRYVDYRRMIAEVAPDGVYAIGQPHLMFDVWLWCLEQGLNLYVEKPMGLTWHQAQALAYLAEQKGAITQVSHQRRSSPLLAKLRDACLERGPIVHAVCEFYKCDPRPYLAARDRMLDDGVHAIDTIRWICGGEVIGIESHGKRIGTPDVNWIGAMLHFDNGSTGFVLTNWNSGRRIFRVELHAPGIAAEADLEGQANVYREGEPPAEELDARAVAGSDEIYVYGGFRAKNREFIDSLRVGRELTSSPFRDCLKTMEVAEKILAKAILSGE
jgi:predicted dehydrogenase